MTKSKLTEVRDLLRLAAEHDLAEFEIPGVLRVVRSRAVSPSAPKEIDLKKHAREKDRAEQVAEKARQAAIDEHLAEFELGAGRLS